MSVRAKFRVSHISDTQVTQYKLVDGKNASTTITAKNISMHPVSGDTPENAKFYASTPGGVINLTTVNPDVQFELGKEYYIDFTEAQ